MTRKLRNKRHLMVEPLEGRVLMSATAALRGFAYPTFELAHPKANGLGAYDTAAPTGITPQHIRHAYGADAISFGGIAGDGSGQTIAIVDAYNDPTAASDLHNFDSAFHLPDPPSFTQLNENGSATGLPGTDPAPAGNNWELEESLDIEWAHVMAPAANLILYEANTPSDSDLFSHALNSARRNPNVTVVSLSFGGDEFSGENSSDSLFTTPAGHSGITFLASTGDSGAPGGYPAYSPNVVAVGGTTLTLNSSGNYVRESGWSSGGGGISSQEPEPAYQQSVQNTGQRSTPDVSIDADPSTGVPVYDTFNTGSSLPWVQLGGTSLAAPLWAGLITVADQGRAINGLSSLDGRTQTLPMLYAAPASNFHDITTGNNGNAAGPGYDLVTGRGSPVANLLVQTLAGTPILTSNAVSTTPNFANTITLRRAASGMDDIWVNVPEASQPTQTADPSQPITVTGGGLLDTLVLDNSTGSPLGSKLILNGDFIAGSLSIAANQQVTLANSSTLTLGSLTIAGGALDLQNGSLQINYGSNPSPDAAIASLVNAGRGANAGIFSSTIIGNANMGVGYIDQRGAGSELVRATLLGDANLDGKVDVTDLGILSTNFGVSGTEWWQGDFSGDGVVNVTDLGMLATNFGQSFLAPTAASTSAARAPAVKPRRPATLPAIAGLPSPRSATSSPLVSTLL